ncbi:PREDICTED: halilectin 3, alpha chain-like [Amphimedon queenslandica]|uniref:Uncharacterized protein n=1 Tax=Amphimedon queenslandica TaxID=400682 RepID=A0A1X7U167_AMPQE|nr:PREDICTED: halilectin 3, alpha chain-like [Amphimedon queenslandica]|eukprot:XP_019856687.1 PREDICTED: halilectin 3, alpha chain-like [Amphimedon queenslandica]
MILALVVVAALFINTGTAQPDEPRCRETPETWSGYLYIISVRSTEARFTISLGSYSRTAQKIKITDVKSMTNEPLRTVLEDYEKRIRYTSVSGSCRNETLEGEFPSYGVPEDAHFDGPVETLGAKIAGLGVTVAHYTIAERGFSYYTYHPLGDEGTQCIPITNSIATLEPLGEDIIQYANVTTVLPTDAFSLPPGCG